MTQLTETLSKKTTREKSRFDFARGLFIIVLEAAKYLTKSTPNSHLFGKIFPSARKFTDMFARGTAEPIIFNDTSFPHDELFPQFLMMLLCAFFIHDVAEEKGGKVSLNKKEGDHLR